MNQMEQIDEGISKLSKNQLGVVATVLSALITAVYGYGSITSQLTQATESLGKSLEEVRQDLKTLQETRFMTNEAIRQIGELKLMMGKLEGRITYIERDGLEILAGARKDAEAQAQRAHRNSN